jgi:hypothetical protein
MTSSVYDRDHPGPPPVQRAPQSPPAAGALVMYVCEKGKT